VKIMSKNPYLIDAPAIRPGPFRARRPCAARARPARDTSRR